MADFNFYLNTQGLRGRGGLKGDAGFSPVITIGQNTLNTFTLIITTQEGTFETPNLRGSIINSAGGGTFLRYDEETDSIYLSGLPAATPTQVGGVSLASEEDLLAGEGEGAITADVLSEGIYGRLKAGDNVALVLNEETGLITISATGGGSTGTTDYTELVNKPAINDVVLKGCLSLDTLDIQGKLRVTDPLQLTITEKSNLVGLTTDSEGNKKFTKSTYTRADQIGSFNTIFYGLSPDTPFTSSNSYILQNSYFSSYVDVPIKSGQTVSIPASIPYNRICMGYITDSGEFVATMITSDGSYIKQSYEGLAFPYISSTALGFNAHPQDRQPITWLDITLTSVPEYTSATYIQYSSSDNRLRIRRTSDNNAGSYRSQRPEDAAKTDILRILGTGDGNKVPLDEIKLLDTTGINILHVDESVLLAMDNLYIPEKGTVDRKLSANVDNTTIIIDGDGKLSTGEVVLKKSELDTYVVSADGISISKNSETNVLEVSVSTDGVTVTTDSNGKLSVADDVLLKEQLYTQLVQGSNITITEDASTHKVTISSSGGGMVDAYTKTETDSLLAAKQDTLVSGTNIKTINGVTLLGEGNIDVSGGAGGASIDDAATSSTSVWSSEKVNAELTSRDGIITNLQGEVVTAQGDIAALDADVSTLNSVVGDHTTSISSINDSIANLMTRIAELESKIDGGNA